MVLNTLQLSQGAESYRAKELLVRDLRGNTFVSTNPDEYEALKAPPDFAVRWSLEALAHDPAASILSAWLNSSDGCPIGEKHFCGRYCFAWNAGHQGNTPYPDLDQKYLRDMEKMRARNANVGIFYSYDTEPLAWPRIIETTKTVLRAVIQSPPSALLLHTRTAHTLDRELVALLKDVAGATNLIVGVAIETDIENPWKFKHYHSVADRLIAMELMAQKWLVVQWTTTPMMGYQDYPGLIQRFASIWVNRIMLGNVKYELPNGWADIARELGDFWLHIPTEEEALAICDAHNFPGWAQRRERYYVSMWSNSPA